MSKVSLKCFIPYTLLKIDHARGAMTHPTMSPTTLIITAALFSLVLVGHPLTSHADKFLESKTSFNAYRERAFQLQNQPQNRYLVGEFTSLTQWMNNAERFLREEEEDDFVRTVHLIRVQLRLIERSIQEIEAREQLLRLTDEMSRLEGKAKQEREGIVELERMMGGSLRSKPQQKKAASVRPQTPVNRPQNPPVQPQAPQGERR